MFSLETKYKIFKFSHLSGKLVEPGVVLLLLLRSPGWPAFQALENLVVYFLFARDKISAIVMLNADGETVTWNPQWDVKALLRRWNLKPATYIS